MHHYGHNTKLCWDKIGHHFCGLEKPYLGWDWCWTNEKKTEWHWCYRTCMIIFIKYEEESAVKSKSLLTLTYQALCNFERVKPIFKMLPVSCAESMLTTSSRYFQRETVSLSSLTLKKLWGGGIKTRPVQQLSLFSKTKLQL